MQNLLEEEFLARQAQNDFWAYRLYINKNLKVGWWQIEVAQKLQQFVEDMIAGKKPVLILQSPPQHGKSVQIIDLMTWVAGKYPRLQLIFASFSKRLGVRANLRMQRIMGGEKFKKVFPGLQLPGPKDKDYTKNRDIIEYVGETGNFRNTTVNGSVTGESLDFGIIDDAIKGRDAATSMVIRDKVWDWLTDDFYTRFSEDAGLLFIGTRWHIDDPMGRWINTEPANLTILKYEAIATQDEIHRKAGEALFPELKSVEFIMARKKVLGTANYLALYQQSPIQEGGNIFRLEDWRYFRMLPEIKFSIIVCDTAMKKDQRHDFSVFMLWCMGVDKNLYLYDILRGKWEAPQLRTQFKAFWAKHKINSHIKLRYAAIEDKQSGTGLIQTVKQYDKIPIKSIQRDTQDKVSRANSAAPVVEAGYVYLLEGAAWLSEFLEEVTLFPDGVHDDQVDTLSDGIDQLYNMKKEYRARTIRTIRG